MTNYNPRIYTSFQILCGSIPESRNIITVPVGEIRASTGPDFYSSKFAFCSAVVLDYGDEALFAHATPESPLGASTISIDTTKVVNSLVKRMITNQIQPSNPKAYINAGSQKALDLISKELTNYGIEVAVANTELAPPSGSDWSNPTRDVYYSLRTKQLRICQI